MRLRRFQSGRIGRRNRYLAKRAGSSRLHAKIVCLRSAFVTSIRPGGRSHLDNPLRHTLVLASACAGFASRPFGQNKYGRLARRLKITNNISKCGRLKIYCREACWFESGLGHQGRGRLLSGPAKFRLSYPVPEIWPRRRLRPGGRDNRHTSPAR